VPELSAQLIAEYTDTVFLSPARWHRAPSAADVLFVFGSPEGRWCEAAHLFHAGLASTILVAGRGPSGPGAAAEPESHVIRDALVRHAVPKHRILVENRSLNTLENVVFGKAITLACCLPSSRLSCATHDATYGEPTVRATDWWKYETSRRRVHGEYVRIQTYARRGDIVCDVPMDEA
jgi:hypothetical protein